MRTKMLIIAAVAMSSNLVMAQLKYPIVDTNQTLCYDDADTISAPAKGDKFYGQDANFVGNQPSYKDNGDGTVTDNVTGLMWQKGFDVMSLDEAFVYAKRATIGGYNDWRVPSIKEAYSLIDFSGVDASNRDMSTVPANARPFINTSFFSFEYGSNGTRKIDTQMISGTKYVGSEGQRMQLVFGVNLADGRIKGYPMMTRNEGKEFTVRLVRGAEYGVNEFKDNKDGTISDLATGLMWQKKDSEKGLNWQSALEYAQKMNKKNYLGFNDWRVPNAKELQSILDYTRSPETTSSAAIDPMFYSSKFKNEAGDKDYPFYWSSTTHVSSALRGGGGGSAAYLSFGRALGNMAQMGGQGGGMRGGQGGGGMHGGQGGGMRGGQGGGGRMYGGGGQGGGERPQMMQGGSTSSGSVNWINIHGAGAQRSDPKSGDLSQYTNGRGPQGDAIRIYNYVRLVRDIK